jgi:hypothetical protein
MSSTADMAAEQRDTNTIAAAILARVFCPDRADWPRQTARGLLRLRFPEEDLDRFQVLLAKHYGNSSAVAERNELERYLFVNCLLTMIHNRGSRLTKRRLMPDGTRQSLPVS